MNRINNINKKCRKKNPLP